MSSNTPTKTKSNNNKTCLKVALLTFFITLNPLNNTALANIGISPSISIIKIAPNQEVDKSIIILRSNAELIDDLQITTKITSDHIDIHNQEKIILEKGMENFTFNFTANSTGLKLGEIQEEIIYFTPKLENEIIANGNKVDLSIGAKIKIIVEEDKILATDYFINKEKNEKINFKIINPIKSFSKNNNTVFQVRIINNSNEQVKNIPYNFQVKCDNNVVHNSKNIHSTTLNPGEQATVKQNYKFKQKGNCQISFSNDYNKDSSDINIYSKFTYFFKKLWESIF